jgi:GAF domain-containing protein
MSSYTSDSLKGERNSLLTSPHKFDSNIESTLAAVCEAAVKLVGVNHSGLVLFDDDRQWGEVVVEYPKLRVPAVGERIEIAGVAAEEKLVYDGEPMVVNDVAGQESLGSVRKLLLRLGIKSIVVVPIIVDGVIRGSFSFDAIDEVRNFQKDEIEQCKNLAHFASVVVKNAYLLRDLDSLGRAVLAITSEDDPSRLLEVIIKEAVNLLSTQGGGIHEYNGRRRELHIKSVYRPPGDIVGKTLKLGEGLAGKLIESGAEYMAVGDYSKWEGRATIFEEKPMANALLGVPLRWKENPIGVLWVHDKPGRVFQKAEIDLLQRFAAVAGIAIEQSRLNEGARYKAERLQNLATATNDIITRLGVSDRDERLTLVAEYAHRIINAEACAILLMQEEGELTLVASHGHRPNGFQRGRKFKIRTGKGTGLTGHIAYMRRVFRECGENLSGHPAAASQSDDFTLSGKCHSLLAIPLKKETGGRGEFLGLLKISNKKGTDGKPHPWTCFTDDDQSIAEIFAQAATVAIQTADLFDEINREKAKFQNLVNTHNIIVRAESPERGLAELAQMLLDVLRKSFCRILLSTENGELLHVIAAAKRPCAKDEFRWNPRIGEKTPIDTWHGLAGFLEKGRLGVLKYKNENDRKLLDQLAEWIDVRNHKGEPLHVESLLVNPLKIGDRLVGLLIVGELRDREGEGFTREQLASALAVSAQASALIDKSWLERRRERRRQLYEKLEKAIRRIRGETTTEKILLAIVREAAAIFSAEVSFLVLERPSSARLKSIDSTGAEGEEPHASLEEVGPRFKEILNANEPMIIHESSGVQGEISSLGYHLKTLLATPVNFAASKFILFVGDSSDDTLLCKADLDILERLGQQGAISLSKALISEQLTRTRDGAHRIAEAMALGNLRRALEEVVKGIRQVIDCGAVTLYRFDTRRNSFIYPPAMDGVWNTSADYLEEPSENAPTWNILRYGKLHVAEDAPNDPMMKCAFVFSEQIRSSAGTPLIIKQEGKDRNIGVMFVNYRDEQHHFTEEDKKNIKLFAHEAAVVIHNMELYEGLNAERARLRALYETERAINSSADLKTIFDTLARQVFEVATANGCRINLADINLQEDNMVRLVAGYPEESFSELRSYVGAGFDLKAHEGERIGIVGRVIQSGVATIENDIESNSDYIGVLNDTRSQLVVPIQNDDGVTVGAISVESADARAFNEYDKELIETLARQASVAVTKDVQRRVSSNAKAIALVGAAGTIWEHRIKGFAEYIKDEVTRLEQLTWGRIDKMAAEYLQSIRGMADAITQSPSTAPLSAEHGVENSLLNPMIETRVRLRNEAQKTVAITTNLSESLEQCVNVSEDWFGHALNLILDNAVRGTEHAAEKRILIRTEMRDPARCVITVSNTGPKIADEIWEKLGNEPIDAGGGSTGRLGIGILLADMILGVYGGKWLKLSNEEDSVTVGIMIPVIHPEHGKEETG